MANETKKTAGSPEELFARGKECYDRGDMGGARKWWLAAAEQGDENAAEALQWAPDLGFETKNGVLVKYKGKGGKVVIPDGVVAIGKFAFEGCKSLTNVVVPNSVQKIEASAFVGSGLTEITIPYGVKVIGDCAFSNCANLTKILLPDSVEEIRKGAFRESGLVEIVIPNGIKKIDNKVFYHCAKLTSVVLPNSVVEICEEAFDSCVKLSSIIIPSSVKTIGAVAFYNCGLKEIVLPNSITKINDETFEGCDQLTHLVLPDSVVEICDIAFSGCESLSDISIPNSVKIIGIGAFDRCALKSVELSENIEELGANPFSCCSDLTRITVSKNNKIYHSVSGCLIHTESKTLVAGCKYSIIPTDGSVTVIGESAFDGYELTSISIPNTVTAIGNYAFSCCNKLKSITIPDTVIEIGDHVFNNCNELTEIVIPKSVMKVGQRVFASCGKLTDIYCEAESMPKDWKCGFGGWNKNCNAAVHWGYKGDDQIVSKQIG